MAKKKKNSGYTTAKTVKKGVVAAWLSAAAFLLVAAIVVGVLGYGTQGFKDWGFSRFAPKTQPELVRPVQPTGNGVILEDDGESDGIALLSAEVARADFATYGVEKSAESVHRFEATFTPAETTATACDWTIKYADGTEVPESVMTIVPDSDGSTRATLTCYNSFDKQIKLTCASRFYNVSVTKNVDYLMSVDVDGDIDLYGIVGRKYGEAIYLPGYETMYSCSLYASGGTVEPDMLYGYVEYTLTDIVYNYLTQRGWNLKKTYRVNEVSPDGLEFDGETTNELEWSIHKFAASSLTSEERQRLESDYKTYCLTNNYEVTPYPIKYVATLYYKGVAYREQEILISANGTEGDRLKDFFSNVPTVSYSINGVDDVIFG